MLNRGVLFLLVVTLALLASPGLTAPVAAAPITWSVDDDPDNCMGPDPADFTTIFEAIQTASPGDTIRVCEGDYTEPSMTIYDNELTITGSGASVTHVHWSGETVGSKVLFNIRANGVVIQGLDLDAPPAHPGDVSAGIAIYGNSVTIQNNEIRNAADEAVYSEARYTQVLSNSIHDNGNGVDCEGDDCVVSGNTVENVLGLAAIYVKSNNGNITSNVVVGVGAVRGWGDDLFVAENQITGPGLVPGSLLYVSGNRVAVIHNTLSDNVGQMQNGLSVGVDPSGSVTIQRNTFTRITNPILLLSWGVGNLAATIGGSPSDANIFVDSGGGLGDANYLLRLADIQTNVNAEYNRWGLCTADQIEEEIYDKADDPAQGLVDYDPFIAPSSCSTPTPTATPTRTPTPTATPGGTATPTPGPTRTVTIPPGSWANFAWTGASSPQTVADCFGAGKIAVMYRLDAASGTFQRWIRGRDELSNMGDVLRFDALLALNASAQPATCIMPDEVVPHSLTIPAGRWANFAWLAGSFPAEVAPQACSEGSIAVIYRLDALTQTFQRWIRGRPDLSNMTDVQPYDALLALNGSGQASNCTFSHYGQLAASSS